MWSRTRAAEPEPEGNYVCRRRSRRPIVAPENLPAGADASKLRSVVVKDYFATAAEYPEDVRREFTGAGACIW